jgi:hypothetical protein
MRRDGAPKSRGQEGTAPPLLSRRLRFEKGDNPYGHRPHGCKPTSVRSWSRCWPNRGWRWCRRLPNVETSRPCVACCYHNRSEYDKAPGRRVPWLRPVAYLSGLHPVRASDRTRHGVPDRHPRERYAHVEDAIPCGRSSSRTITTMDGCCAMVTCCCCAPPSFRQLSPNE